MVSRRAHKQGHGLAEHPYMCRLPVSRVFDLKRRGLGGDSTSNPILVENGRIQEVETFCDLMMENTSPRRSDTRGGQGICETKQLQACQ